MDETTDPQPTPGYYRFYANFTATQIAEIRTIVRAELDELTGNITEQIIHRLRAGLAGPGTKEQEGPDTMIPQD